MLDLNFSITDSTCNDENQMIKEEEEDSGTSSNSSVVNTDQQVPLITPRNNGDSASNFSSVFIFDILKKEKHTEEEEGKYSLPELVTRPFFPVIGNNGAQWLNLSFGEVQSGERQAETRNAMAQKQPQVRKSRRGPRSRSSQYRGVTFYRRTGRWESHIWDCGKQVYLGGFDTAHAAARTYDQAAIKFRGFDADINFNISDYEEDLKQMKNLSKEEFLHRLRRGGTGISRGSSKFRGIALHKRWETRMGHYIENKIYDEKMIKCNGRDARTDVGLRPYKGEAIVDANNGGSGRYLDLSLGISLASNRPQGNDTDGPKEIRAAGKRKVESVCSPKLTNWALQIQGNGNQISPNIHLPSNIVAASSGFSSSTTNKALSFSHNYPNTTTVQNFRYALPTPTNL